MTNIDKSNPTWRNVSSVKSNQTKSEIKDKKTIEPLVKNIIYENRGFFRLHGLNSLKPIMEAYKKDLNKEDLNDNLFDFIREGLNEKSDWELTFSTKSNKAKYETDKKITEENILNALKDSKDDIKKLNESLGRYDGQLNLTESLGTVYNFGGWGGPLLDSGFNSSYKNY